MVSEVNVSFEVRHASKGSDGSVTVSLTQRLMSLPLWQGN